MCNNFYRCMLCIYTQTLKSEKEDYIKSSFNINHVFLSVVFKLKRFLLLHLTSKANRLLHFHPLRARHGNKSPLLPPHQAHGDYITSHVLPGLHGNHTATTGSMSNFRVKVSKEFNSFIFTSSSQLCAQPHSRWGTWTSSCHWGTGSAACTASKRCVHTGWCEQPEEGRGRWDKMAPHGYRCAVEVRKEKCH